MKFKVGVPSYGFLPINVSLSAVNEPGVQYQCDSCACDLTHTVRIKCADPLCESDEGVDICPSCFCAGKEFKQHKRSHAYRVIVRDSIRPLTFCVADELRKSIRTRSSQKTGEQTSKLSVCNSHWYMLSYFLGNYYC